MRKKVFITALLFMFVIGAVFAEKGDLRLTVLGGGEISYDLTDHAVLGVYLMKNMPSRYPDLDVSLYSTPGSTILPVTFRIMGGWNVLNGKNNEFLIGGMVTYGHISEGATGKTVTVNSTAYDQYDYVATFSIPLFARYTYTFNFGLFLGISVTWNVSFNAYENSNTDVKSPLVLDNLGPNPVIGWKFHL